MALSSIQARPLVVAPKATAAKPAPAANQAPVASKPAVATAPVKTQTTPLILDLIVSGVKGALAPLQLLWSAVPSAIRNVRDITNGKISVGRGAANIITDTGVGVGQAALAGTTVQAASIIAGPLLVYVPAAMLPFAGIAIGIGTLIGTYALSNFILKKTGAKEKLANGLTKLFGGDKPAPAPAPAKA